MSPPLQARTRRDQARSVACPFCRAEAGERCMTRQGRRRWAIWAVHRARLSRWRALYAPQELTC